MERASAAHDDENGRSRKSEDARQRGGADDSRVFIIVEVTSNLKHKIFRLSFQIFCLSFVYIAGHLRLRTAKRFKSATKLCSGRH